MFSLKEYFTIFEVAKQTMGKKKTQKVYYTQQVIDDGGVRIPIRKSKDVICSFTKRYHNSLYLLVGLPSSSRDLLDYLCEHADQNNMVASNLKLRMDYIRFISDISSKTIIYSDATVKKALSTLIKRGLVITMSRGLVQVNPEYFYGLTESKRINLIQKNYHHD